MKSPKKKQFFILFILSLQCLVVHGKVRGYFKCKNRDINSPVLDGLISPTAVRTTNVESGSTTPIDTSFTNSKNTKITKVDTTNNRHDTKTTPVTVTTTENEIITTDNRATTVEGARDATKADAMYTQSYATRISYDVTLNKTDHETTGNFSSYTNPPDVSQPKTDPTTTPRHFNTITPEVNQPQTDRTTTSASKLNDSVTTGENATVQESTYISDIPNPSTSTGGHACEGITQDYVSINENETSEMSDCQELFEAGFNESGIYTVLWGKAAVQNKRTLQVYCNMTDLVNDSPGSHNCGGGGWTVFQRRVNGSVDFNCDNYNYRNGFGQLDHEFWLGNEKLAHVMAGNYQLRIDLINSQGEAFFACYENFRIFPAENNMKIGSYITGGNAGDGFPESRASSYHFCTFESNSSNCGNHCECPRKSGGWWYRCWNPCIDSNLNGKYDTTYNTKGIRWNSLHDNENCNIKFSEMKLRRKR